MSVSLRGTCKRSHRHSGDCKRFYYSFRNRGKRYRGAIPEARTKWQAEQAELRIRNEVFEGRFDGERLAHYLESIATGRETYAGHTIYTIAVHDGETTRPLRIAQVGYDAIAASNMPTAEQIHSILDRHLSAASPFSGSSLLSARYRDVPLLSSAWGIGHIGLPFSDRGFISLFGVQLPLPEDTTFVASLRYTGSLRLRIEEISPTEADAAQAAQKLSMLLGLFQSLQQVQPRSAQDAAFLRMMSTIKMDQHKDRAILTATVPIELLQSLTNPTESSSGSTTSESVSPAKPAH